MTPGGGNEVTLDLDPPPYYPRSPPIVPKPPPSIVPPPRARSCLYSTWGGVQMTLGSELTFKGGVEVK